MKAKNSTNVFGDLAFIILVTLFFCSVGYVFSVPSVRQETFDISKWSTYFKNLGGSGLLVSVCVFAVVNACGFPRIWISALAGAVYGVHMGIWIAQISTLLGATLNFFIARWILREPVKRRLNARFRAWYEHFGANGFWWVLYIRLFPVGNATLTNLVSGASQIPYRDFLLATFLGYLPFTITFALFGHSAAKQKPFQLAAGFCLLFVIVAVRWLYNGHQRKKRKLETFEDFKT